MNNLHKPAKNKLKAAVFSLDGEAHACAIIRILGPLQFQEWDVVWAAKTDRSGILFDLETARDADLIIIQRHFPSASTESVLGSIVRLGIPIVYDLDDAFLDVPPFHPLYGFLSARAPYIKWVLKEADLIVVSTAALKETLNRYTSRPIAIQPNLIDWGLFSAQPRKPSGQFNFLISGTPTHHGDWAIIEDPLAEILVNYKNDVNAVFFGALPKRFTGHPAVKLLQFEADYKSYASRIRDLDIHAALVPLEDTEFNRCKSDIKWLEYSAAGIAGIFSNTTPYNLTIRNRETGLLVKNTAEAWFHGIEHLLTNPEAAGVMIAAAQREVREHRSIEAMSGAYAAVFSDLLGTKHVRRIFSELPTLPNRLQTRADLARKYGSAFLHRHVFWRFNRKN